MFIYLYIFKLMFLEQFFFNLDGCSITFHMHFSPFRDFMRQSRDIHIFKQIWQLMCHYEDKVFPYIRNLVN